MKNTHLRLDPEIFVDARKALDEDPGVPQDVRVHVYGGTVTLTGTVRSTHQKSEAEAVVRRVAGVGEIVNSIVVAHVVSPETLEAPESR